MTQHMKQIKVKTYNTPTSEIIDVKPVNFSDNFEKKKNLFVESIKQMSFGFKDFIVGLFKTIAITVMFVITTTYVGYKTLFSYADKKAKERKTKGN